MFNDDLLVMNMVTAQTLVDTANELCRRLDAFSTEERAVYDAVLGVKEEKPCLYTEGRSKLMTLPDS